MDKDTQYILEKIDAEARRSDDRFDKIDNKLDSQGDRLDEYNKQLEIHILGVEVLKKMHKDMDTRIQPLEKEYISKKILEEHNKTSWKKWAAYLGVLATIIAIVTGLIELL